MISHILKSYTVDAQTCIELFFNGKPQTVLKHAFKLFFRIMWWCQLRQAEVRIVLLGMDTQH